MGGPSGPTLLCPIAATGRKPHPHQPRKALA
ncbi:DUF6053 domain-containing protein [Lysobacter enzymogenes]